MENHCIEEPFIIRSYRKSDEAMYRSGEARGDHRYTRRQVRLIVETLGEP